MVFLFYTIWFLLKINVYLHKLELMKEKELPTNALDDPKKRQELEKCMQEFAENLISEQTDLDPEAQAFINENIWELF